MISKLSKILFSELRTLIRSSTITSNKKFIIGLELIQHLKNYNADSKGKFKRFFRKYISFFPQTYKSFSKIFNLERMKEDRKKAIIWYIEKEINHIFREPNKWDLFYSVIFLFIHILLFSFIFVFISKLDFLIVLSRVSGSIIVISLLYFLFAFGSPILLYEFEYLTREWEKMRRFIRDIDKMIFLVVIIFYFNSWITILLVTNNPGLLDHQIIVQFIFVPSIIFPIMMIIDTLNKHKMMYYDDLLIYLHYFIILSKFNYNYRYDLPYFFRKLLNSFNDCLIYNFGIKIRNQEQIENKFFHLLLSGNSFEIKKIGVQLESRIYEIDDLDIRFKNKLNIYSIQKKFEEIFRNFEISNIEFKYITSWEKFSSSNINKILKIFLPIVGVSITIIAFLMSL